MMARRLTNWRPRANTQGFMMYMSGSTIQIFSAMAVIMLVKNAIGGALNVNNGMEQIHLRSRALWG